MLMKIGLFFGAGAEVGYGLPSGGKFAIDLFRHDVSEQKKSLRAELGGLNNLSTYVTDWLPDKYKTGTIYAFGKSEFSSLIESSIEYRKNEIIRRLSNFDSEADKALKDLNIDKAKFQKVFKDKTGKDLGEQVYSQAIKMNKLLAEEVKLFGSEYYSAMLDTIKTQGDTTDIEKYAGAFLQLLVGAHGQELVTKLNHELFEQAPDDIPIFDDVTGMFKIEFSRAGLTALDLLLNERRPFDPESEDLSEILPAIAQQILENLFTTVLDYQSLIDSHFRYLYSPKTEWAKFTKMVVFLRATREYIVGQLEDAGDLPDHGYYHDLSSSIDLNIELTSIGTANYNNIVESISDKLGFAIPDVKHLNGGVNDYYNPYKNSVISAENVDDIPTDQIHVPFILTQSGLKPLTSVDMSRRYVGLFDDYKNSDAVVVIGYGFNIDDSHINGLFRQVIEESGRHLYWVSLNTDGDAEKQKRNLVRRLRISPNNKDKVTVVPVDIKERKIDGKSWLEYIRDSFQEQYG
jgi:hypothetical protein